MKEEFDKEMKNLKIYLDTYKGPYLTGKDFTLADSNLAVDVSLVVHNKVFDLSDHPEVQKWYDLCIKQKGIKKVLEDADAFWENAMKK